jgi:aryl-alcohol dehydrogenase-like predicted oxidoreductase
MRYRKHRDLRISEVGVGTYSLSGVYGTKNIEGFKSMINRAFELGVNFFDTAEAYGNAEEILGKAVKAFRKEIYIATKVGIREGYKPNLSREYIRKACEESLKRLQTDYIDLYQVHFNDPNTPMEDTIDVLEELVDKGKIRYYGVCHLPKEVIEDYCKIGNPFSALVELSAVARESHGNIFPLYQKYDLGIIAFSTTGRGLLTGRFKENQKFEAGDIRSLDPSFQHERLRSGLKIAKKLAELGERYGKTSTQVAIAWVLAQPEVTCALTGPSTIEHLEENVEGSGWDIPEEDLEELEAFFKREDEWLKQEQRITVRRILSKPLQEPQRAFVDLIYAIETGMSLHLISEKEVLPVFYELYGMKEELNKSGIEPKLEKIRAQLRNLIPLETE